MPGLVGGSSYLLPMVIVVVIGVVGTGTGIGVVVVVVLSRSATEDVFVDKIIRIHPTKSPWVATHRSSKQAIVTFFFSMNP